MKKVITYSLVVSVMLLGAVAIFPRGIQAGDPSTPKNQISESNAINKQIVNNIPIPKLTTSSERKNVAKRAEIFNNEDKMSYIYLVNYGRVMAFFPVAGKVSSLQSYMSPTDKLVDTYGNDCKWTSPGSCYVIDAPDIDGTYGNNVDGIFFFTTDGAYVEWRGDYMMSDQPLQLTTQPELVRNIK